MTYTELEARQDNYDYYLAVLQAALNNQEVNMSELTCLITMNDGETYKHQFQADDPFELMAQISMLRAMCGEEFDCKIIEHQAKA